MQHYASAPNVLTRMGPLAWALLVCLSFLWGGSFFFNEIALRGLPPLVVARGRLAVGCLGLSVLLALSSQPVRPWLSRWREFTMMGIVNTFIPFTLIVWGQQHIDSGLAAVINAATPAFTVLPAHFFTCDERPLSADS